MKRLLLVTVIVVFVLTFVSFAGAWQVNVTNSCNKKVTIVVYGNRLFWKSRDCVVDVNSGATGVCQMPGGICPTDIDGAFFSGTSVYDLNKIPCMDESLPCCWNVNVEVVQMTPDSCQLKIR